MKEIKSIANELQNIINREVAFAKRDNEKYRIAFNEVLEAIDRQIRSQRQYAKQAKKDKLPLKQLQCESAIEALDGLKFEIERYIKPSEEERERTTIRKENQKEFIRLES